MTIERGDGRRGMKGGTDGGSGCPESARVSRAVRQLLSEEVSSSSLPSLSRELKSHLASCGICAAESRALDPTLLFVPMGAAAAAPPSAEDVRQVADDVLAEVRRRERVSTRVPARPILSRRFLQAAALVALAAGLFGIQGVRLARQKAELSAGNAPTVAPGLEPDIEIAAFGEVGGERVRRPLIQDLKNPTARVYEFAAVSAKEPSVVFIADPHADL
ncbi:MAG: hypothetical protein NEA02_18150 [Thermoanaerobaculia bacterium]|nr:hypothetical protein [Thermoanaerobaculia bacterium]